MNSTEYEKLKTAMRHWVMGLMNINTEYQKVIEAMNLAEKYHTGERKGGEHEFSHQLNIFCYLRGLCSKVDDDTKIKILITALLHDTYEDYPESASEIAAIGDVYLSLAKNISKVHDGKKMSNDDYYTAMLDDSVCALVKCVDRIHNLSTCKAFREEKRKSYVKETRDYVIPLASKARKKYHNFGDQFEITRQTLSMMCDLLEI